MDWKHWILNGVAVLVVLVVAWLLSMWVRRLIHAALTRAKFDATLTKFFAQAARWAILVAAVLIAMRIFGIEATSFAALIAAMGLAIGLAFQGTLSNFAAGVMLLTFRPFKVGDVVEVAGELGIIDEIELFFTQMDTFDNRRVILPNSQIFGNTIENLSHHQVRRADFNVGTAYGADLDQARGDHRGAHGRGRARCRPRAASIVDGDGRLGHGLERAHLGRPPATFGRRATGRFAR